MSDSSNFPVRILSVQREALQNLLATSEPFSNSFYIESDLGAEVLDATIGRVRADIEGQITALDHKIAEALRPKAACLLIMSALKLNPDKAPRFSDLLREFDPELVDNLRYLALDPHGRELLGRWTWKAVPIANLQEEIARLLASNLHFAVVGTLSFSQDSNLDKLEGSYPKIQQWGDTSGLILDLSRTYGGQRIEMLLQAMRNSVDRLEAKLDQPT